MKGGMRALRSQAVMHIFVVMLTATLGLATIGIFGYGVLQERETRQKGESLGMYYRDQLVRAEYAWKNTAEQLRSRLEFARILEERDARRWPKLTAFLNAQRIFVDFPTLLVLDGHGGILFRYGVIAHTLDAQTVQSSDWHYVASLGELYRVFRQPVWLGDDGEGLLVLLKPLDNMALKGLVTPDVSLAVTWHGQLVAASSDDYSSELISAQSAVVQSGDRRLVQARLDWPGSAAQRPLLLAYRELRDILPFREFLAWLLAAVAAITVLLWVALGRWLTHMVRRLEAVDHALDAYAQRAAPAAVAAQLSAVKQQRDEIGNLADAVSELMRAVDAREREQTVYLETLALLEEAVLELNCDGTILRASPGWNTLAHCDDATGRNLLEFFHPDDAGALKAQCGVLRSGEKDSLLFRVRLLGASPLQQTWIECRFLGFRDERGEVAGIRGVLRDITQAYLHEKQISHMALHDALTGLPNRVLLEDRLKVALRLASRSGDKVCVCFIDIDHFKNVNDTLGHKTGDRLLVMFTELLCSELRAGDTLARWGGDEFVLLLPEMRGEQDIREVTNKVRSLIRRPLLLEGAELRVTFSVGVAVYPDDAENSDVLFSQADRAMFYAKAQGRNQVCFFGDMTSKGIGKKELYIQNRLASAINAGQIQAWFQPIVSAAGGTCTTAEVLARWHDDELGWISPATFIPMAENIGLIRELGQQVWLASLDLLAECRRAGCNIRFAVNVSKRQLFIPSFTEQAVAELARRDLAPNAVIWEVTETVALRDVEHAAERLLELRSAGFRIAIDDFGTGYSSLSQLHEIHADELKIDISFVRRIHEPAGLSLVQAIISIAHALGLKTVAEGVEDARSADVLRGLGVDYLQGYYFARPMPREEFLRWLDDRVHGAGADGDGLPNCDHESATKGQ